MEERDETEIDKSLMELERALRARFTSKGYKLQAANMVELLIKQRLKDATCKLPPLPPVSRDDKDT